MSHKPEYTIYRDSWLRGRPSSVLFDEPTQKMCCLGQILHQDGVPLSSMDDVGYPSSLDAEYAEKNTLLFDPDMESDTQLAETAMRTNDAVWKGDDGLSEKITDAEREASLTELFAAENVTLTFVNGVAPWV